MAHAKPLHLRLFLEGVEVPVISAQVSINMNAPASAAIQIIPLDSAQDLKPRTMVHLFFLDTEGVKKENSFTGIKGTYRLLFSGEAVGFSYVQTPQSRGVVLQCVDFSNYWDSAHATAISYGPGGNLFHNLSGVYGSNAGIFDDLVDFPAQKLVDWLKQTPLTPGLQTVSGLAGGVIHMMEIMGGVPGHAKGINDFFTVAELRCRLLQQIAAEENDDTAYRLLNSQVFMEWLTNGLQSLGAQITFRDMMLFLFKYIFYEFVPNPAAKYDPEKKGTKEWVSGGEYQFKSSPKVRSALQHIKNAHYEVGAAVRSSTNDQGQLANLSQTILQEVGAAQNDLKAIVKVPKASRTAFNNLKNTLTNVYGEFAASRQSAEEFEPAKNMLNHALSIIENELKGVVQHGRREVSTAVIERLKTQIIRPDCWFSPPPKCNVIFPEQYAQISYDRSWLAETTRVLVQSFNTLIGRDELLNNYYLAPSFGSQTADLNESMKGESSYRYLLDHEIHTGILPKTEWLPNTSAINTKGKDKAQIKSERGTWLHRAALFHFFKYRFAPRQASVAGRFNPFVVCGFPALIIRQPCLTPDKLEEIKKDIADTGLYGDDSVTDSKILSYLDDFGGPDDLALPSQLVGQVAGVSHNVDQSGGTTSISMHHVRRHLGVDDDFLNLYLETLERPEKVVKSIIRLDQVKESKELLQLLVSLTPQVDLKPLEGQKRHLRPNTLSDEIVTEQYDAEAGKQVYITKSGKRVSVQEVEAQRVSNPYITTGGIEKAQVRQCWVPSQKTAVGPGSVGKGLYPTSTIVGVEVLSEDLPEAVPEVGKKARAYKAVALYEEIEITVPGKLPIEEVIRPAWFSLKYRSDKIGKDIYQPFFGCDSIIDQLMVDQLAKPPPELPQTPADSTVTSLQAKDYNIAKVVADLQKDEAARNELSIERAVNLIGLVYGQVKAGGQDVDDFIRSYTDRPIATLEDIFGSEGLRLRLEKDGVVAYKSTSTGDSETITNEGVRIGFHTTAVHPDVVDKDKPLVGLIVDPSSGLQRLGTAGEPSPVPGRYDVRWSKKDRVLKYLVDLRRGVGRRG